MKQFLITIGLFALFVVSIVLNLTQCRSNHALRQRVKAVSQATGGGQAKIIERYFHDSVEHVVIREVPAKTTDEKAAAVGNEYLDTLTRALKVAVKQVDEATRINAALVAENIRLRQDAEGDQVYRDRWLRLIYHPDSNSVDLSYDVALNQVRYWKRSWLLGPKRYYNDLYSEDPRVSIASVKRFTLPEGRPKPAGLGLSAGYGYSPFSNEFTPYLGVGLSYNLIRF